ncbi:hypothetical protein K4H28_14550 [Deefgea tanakiae]|uniref:Uncharacterized protein n=1 Tax=Deefgea tanakiae TaxID=2865840 RepID=A0ABX8Z4I7_9NEIS|nr:hypothetical protein [Deefgea tanakiae]QZA77484.1 hypothetical protein K4H28_14550 [Deefgea tanakiae]
MNSQLLSFCVKVKRASFWMMFACISLYILDVLLIKSPGSASAEIWARPIVLGAIFYVIANFAIACGQKR